MLDLKPADIVHQLDKHIVGQQRAKRAIAIALRNRWRSQHSDQIDIDELIVHHYLCGGPRGSGRTRTITHAAQAVAAPFARLTFIQLAAAGTAQRAIDMVIDQLIDSASSNLPHAGPDVIRREVEQHSIILIDDIERWVSGVEDGTTDPLNIAQQALLGLAAGNVIESRHGRVQTGSMMLFATGSVVAARPGDIPLDLHVLFPRRIDLEPLQQEDLIALLSNDAISPLADYLALLRVDGIDVQITADGIEALAAEAIDQNRRIEDLGARRLPALIEVVLDDLLFGDASQDSSEIVIDAAYVVGRIAGDVDEEDLEDFIL
jgi:ATP-dependent protease HslVU (ClpYQ) ATPase subunit